MTEKLTPRDVNGHPDATVWARYFMQKKEEFPEIANSEESMVGWFANAMQSAVDSYRVKKMLEEAGVDNISEYIDSLPDNK